MNALQTISDRRTEILRDLAGRVAERLLRKGYCTYSLLGGDFGEVLFLYYYSRIDAGYERIADELLDKTFRSIRYLPLVGTYCNGLSGFGYGLLMLEEAGFVEGAAEALPELDARIDDTLAAFLQEGKIDFLHGFVGYGFYFLKQYTANPAKEKCRLMRIVSALQRLSIAQDGCIKWQFSDEPEKRFNISLSHGMSSVIVLLCKILATVGLTATERADLQAMITGAVGYLLTQRIDHEKYGSWFISSSIECEARIRRSRLGWCYGDPGVSVALYDAGAALGRADLTELASTVLEYAAMHRRNPAGNGIYDMGLCHGAAGVAQIFKTMSQRTSSQAMKEAWLYWDRIVESNAQTIADGKYEYLFYNPIENKSEQKTGLLEGSAGIGLYLLNAGEVLPQLLILS